MSDKDSRIYLTITVALTLLFIILMDMCAHCAPIRKEQIEDYAVRNTGDTMTGDLSAATSTIQAATGDFDNLILDGEIFATPTPGIGGGGGGGIGGAGTPSGVAIFYGTDVIISEADFVYNDDILYVSKELRVATLYVDGDLYPPTPQPTFAYVAPTAQKTPTPLGGWPTYATKAPASPRPTVTPAKTPTPAKTSTPQPTFAYTAPTLVPTLQLPTIVAGGILQATGTVYGYDMYVPSGEQGGGNIGGGGSSNQVAYFVDSATIAGDVNMTWDSALRKLALTNGTLVLSTLYFDANLFHPGSYTVISNAERSKLNGIEAGADVTDAGNVAGAGAIMDGDFSSNGLMKRTGAGTYTVITDNSSVWNTPPTPQPTYAYVPPTLRPTYTQDYATQRPTCNPTPIGYADLTGLPSDDITAGNQLGWTTNTLDVQDGSGSGLDADLLDGMSSGAFIQHGVPTNDYMLVALTGEYVSTSPSGVRSALGLGSLAVLSNVDNNNWDALGTDLTVGNGGTGASTASGARTNLEIGTESQIEDILGINFGTNKTATNNYFLVGDGTDWESVAPSTAKSSIGLGVVPNVNFQGASWSQDDGYYIGTGEIRAIDSDGLLLRPSDQDYGIYIADNGRVHIGAGTAPDSILHVAGQLTVDGNVVQDANQFIRSDELRAADSGGLKLMSDDGITLGIQIADNGTVGIGTAPTGYDLAVADDTYIYDDLIVGDDVTASDGYGEFKYLRLDEAAYEEGRPGTGFLSFWMLKDGTNMYIYVEDSSGNRWRFNHDAYNP